jgi:hypothetical protein
VEKDRRGRYVIVLFEGRNPRMRGGPGRWIIGKAEPSILLFIHTDNLSSFSGLGTKAFNVRGTCRGTEPERESGALPAFVLVLDGCTLVSPGSP